MFTKTAFVKQFLEDTRDSLFSWCYPYPEDLLFYKGEDCLFSSCTHEKQYGLDPRLTEKLAHLLI